MQFHNSLRRRSLHLEICVRKHTIIGSLSRLSTACGCCDVSCTPTRAPYEQMRIAKFSVVHLMEERLAPTRTASSLYPFPDSGENTDLALRIPDGFFGYDRLHSLSLEHDRDVERMASVSGAGRWPPLAWFEAELRLTGFARRYRSPSHSMALALAAL
jgi:hypothetical protein